MKRTGQYAPIDDLQLYYELHGSGHPLALLHGGGSSMTTTYGRILPQLALGRCVIGVDAQAHGRTRDNGRPLSFERDADNLAALLDVLGIGKTDLMGFSNGATTALHFAIRHPVLVEHAVRLFRLMAHARLAVLPGGHEDYLGGSLAVDPGRTLPDLVVTLIQEFLDA